MRRHVIALGCALAVLLALGAGAAQAQSVQGAQQTAVTGQKAASEATSTQVAPTNSNISVRVFSPGDGGSVTQENSSGAAAAALNAAQTTQAAEQSQTGGGGEQAAGQSAATGQHAAADATSTQVAPSNSNIAVRIHSPGDDGDVSQSNRSEAVGLAGNAARTGQVADQEQGGHGGCCSGAGVQAVGQEAETLQEADADARSEQYHPSNSNISVRIGSRGDNGSVTQSNGSAAKALAGNAASTKQIAGQEQDGCACGGDRVQAVGQKAITGQKAEADASSIQKGASNRNVPVRIFSDGDDGDVTQSNSSTALAAAGNLASTVQAAEQEQGGRCGCRHASGHGGAGVQAVGQWAETWQAADADAESKQLHPSNLNATLRIKSKGDGGHVDQSNDSTAAAFSLNLARTLQWVGQEQ